MGSYIIKATNLSSETGTVIVDVGFFYTDVLNDVNEAEIKISSTGSVKRSLLEIGSEIEISRNGTLEFLGVIDNINYLIAGTVTFHVSGYEWWLATEKGDYANSPWTNTASATIFGDILAESNYLTAGTINAGFNIDFRLSKSQSLWNGLANLAKKTTQDIQVDYPNKEIDILNHRGSSSSVATYNENVNINNVRVNLGYPLGNHILVYGKGDGANQILGAAENAASIATYGRIKRPITDRSIVSTAEANKLADAELALTKDIVKIIDFDFINPNESVKTGDIITLNAEELSDEEVRIVGLERGMRGGDEYLTAQVTNPAFKQLMRRRNKLLARMMKDNLDQTSYMQGSGNTNTWGSGINAKTSYPLKIGFHISNNYLFDEVGNKNILDFTVSYDIDKYQSQFGTASFDGSDPQVQNTSGDRGANLTGSMDDNDNFGVSDAGVAAGGGYISTGTHASFTNIGNFNNITGAYTIFTITLIPDGSGDPYAFRIYNSDSGEYYPNSGGINIVSAFAVDYIAINIVIPDNIVVDDLDLEIKNATTGCDMYVLFQSFGEHTHGFGSLDAADHDHPNGGYDINAADIDNISIGDDVGEAVGVNAASVNLYLDFWNGSSWINKHTISNTGVTIDTDVDITDGDTYPDAAGYWRVRIEPITATADFAQGIVRIKNSIDN